MASAEKAFLNIVLAGNNLPSSAQSCVPQQAIPSSHTCERPSCPPELPLRIEAEVVDLFRDYASALSRYAASVTRDRELAQDGIQEAFLRYFAARVGGLQVENPRAWLFRVLRNYIFDRHRKSGFVSSVGLEAAGNLADNRQNQQARYEQTEFSELALASLSKREQECMQLRLEGLGYEEIADVLQIRSGTVGALLTRGLKKIRESGLFTRRS
jgi:RNA polymerase sigma-70 factor (ECF subfamily)